MPPKAKITKEMIVNAAFEIAKEEGSESLSVRAVAKKLGCSTQPVMYCFSTIEEIKKAAYFAADKYHSEYITRISQATDNPMLEIGLNYIRFAAEEKLLFRFLFQSDCFASKNFTELIDTEELSPILQILSQAVGVSSEQAKEIFLSVFMTVHGYASMLANNSMDYDEHTIANQLKKVMTGAIYSSTEEQ